MIVQEIHLNGEPYTIGYKHGKILRSKIQEFLNDKFAHINLIRHEKLSKNEIFELVHKYAILIEEDLPQIAEEIHGLAKGAHITYEEAVLLQIRREIIGHSSSTGGECSLIASMDHNKRATIAQTIDLNGEMVHLGQVFRITSSKKNIPEILLYSFAGLLGYVGLNSSGLAIGINFVLADGWKPGVSPYLLVRHLLNLHTLEECIAELKRIRRSSSRSLTICDKSNLAIIEMTVNELRIIPGTNLSRTNHFLHEDFKMKDQMNIFSRNASILRLQKLNTYMEETNWSTDTDVLFDIFSDHSLYPVGLCAHSEGKIGREDTVAAVVLKPSSGLIATRKGHPCTSESCYFVLKLNE
jgi:isopenicillin-N N-acyltransferase-like protein